MFTGIIERTGSIQAVREVPGGRHLRIEVGPIAGSCVPGASVCVSGVCLTVTAVDDRILSFDVITETLDRSTLGTKRVGDRVNLERSLRIGDRLDGHFVQGHVDGRGVVRRIETSSREHVVWIDPDKALQPCLIPKGSVAVDGVSLTIAAVAGDAFSIALIPTTLQRTTLGSLKSGVVVNLETDIIARTLIHQLSRMRSSEGLTLSTLREAGLA